MSSEQTASEAAAVINYDEAKRLIVSADPADRRRVAGDPSARAEVLFYLATDPDPAVRQILAGNAATPAKANLLLTRDTSEAVRATLAQKIARLAPSLDERQSNRIQQITYQTLEKLVADQTVRIRQIVSEALSHIRDAPVEIIHSLARDPEIAVAGPPLQYSPLLTDEDLLDILHQVSAPGAASAIARREGLSPAVADVIGTGEDVEAITALLQNVSAQIREETLDRLIARAPAQHSWHRPLVDRPVLSDRAVCKLAQFVAHDMLDTLQRRTGLSSDARDELQNWVTRRLSEAPGETPPVRDHAIEAAEAMQKIRALLAQGELNEERMADAADEGQNLFVTAGLAVLAGLELSLVERVLRANSPKGIAALVWRANLSARFASKVQVKIARMPGASVLYPKPDGSYQLTPEAMNWQLEFFMNLEEAGK